MPTTTRRRMAGATLGHRRARNGPLSIPPLSSRPTASVGRSLRATIRSGGSHAPAPAAPGLTAPALPCCGADRARAARPHLASTGSNPGPTATTLPWPFGRQVDGAPGPPAPSACKEASPTGHPLFMEPTHSAHRTPATRASQQGQDLLPPRSNDTHQRPFPVIFRRERRRSRQEQPRPTPPQPATTPRSGHRALR